MIVSGVKPYPLTWVMEVAPVSSRSRLVATRRTFRYPTRISTCDFPVTPPPPIPGLVLFLRAIPLRRYRCVPGCSCFDLSSNPYDSSGRTFARFFVTAMVARESLDPRQVPRDAGWLLLCVLHALAISAVSNSSVVGALSLGNRQDLPRHTWRPGDTIPTCSTPACALFALFSLHGTRSQLAR